MSCNECNDSNPMFFLSLPNPISFRRNWREIMSRFNLCLDRLFPKPFTHLKHNSSPRKSYLPKRNIVFQPSIFRGELSNFGGVSTVDPRTLANQLRRMKPSACQLVVFFFPCQLVSA